MAGRPRNRSEPIPLSIGLPAQTHAYLAKLATQGALGTHESAIAAQIVISEVERLMSARRAETVLARSTEPSTDDDV